MAEDRMNKMWEAQAEQQRDLGMDPRHMSDVDRRIASGDLVLSLHEEVNELQRATTPHYKRHLLDSAAEYSGNVADDVADVLKLAFAIAQLHGLTLDEVAEAFHRKTNVVRARAAAARQKLKSSTRVICVDLDDVIADLSPWTRELGRLRGDAPPNARTLQMMESWKDDWYKSGRFGDLEPIPGSCEALRKIASWGWKIVVVTARPQWQYKRLYADTLEWLQRHEIPHDLILFNKDKVEAIYEHIAPAWPVAFIEDHERNARHLSAAGVPVLLFDRPHNRGIDVDGVTRVEDWAQVLKHLEQGA